ncbi:hypothetical protein LX77_03842 [Gelidibacter algens]|jgi:AcrR family transcriptional regulator|uniref:IcaR C-terminal domain-containing protein n=1 Tax=Gelidibacter algens TaxID=49280 RepID=A0A1A7R143_9FLAO|nr:TetR/AcrR family transcriptional regulator [Gelidibacter algens]OBX25243.1 hypothetical protein A9996_10995 [Gelidibacter algens]RAJ17720.1 hypothetical protein LX77_03842 [Gelidibacter algens]
MFRKHLSTQRCKEIVVSFHEVARDLGLENAYIAMLAQHMEINKGPVLHYFKDREELLLGLIEYILEHYLRVMISERSDVMDCKVDVIRFIEDLFGRASIVYFDDGFLYSCYALIYRVAEFR